MNAYVARPPQLQWPDRSGSSRACLLLGPQGLPLCQTRAPLWPLEPSTQFKYSHTSLAPPVPSCTSHEMGLLFGTKYKIVARISASQPCLHVPCAGLHALRSGSVRPRLQSSLQLRVECGVSRDTSFGVKIETHAFSRLLATLCQAFSRVSYSLPPSMFASCSPWQTDSIMSVCFFCIVCKLWLWYWHFIGLKRGTDIGDLCAQNTASYRIWLLRLFFAKCNSFLLTISPSLMTDWPQKRKQV